MRKPQAYPSDDAVGAAPTRGPRPDDEPFEGVLTSRGVVAMALVPLVAAAASYAAWAASGRLATAWGGAAALASPPTWPVHMALALAATGLAASATGWRRRKASLAPPFVAPTWFQETVGLVEGRRVGSEGHEALRQAVKDVAGQLMVSTSMVRVWMVWLALATPALATAWSLAVMGTGMAEGRPLIDLAAPLIVAIAEGTFVVALAVAEDRSARMAMAEWEQRVYEAIGGARRAATGPGVDRSRPTMGAAPAAEAADRPGRPSAAPERPARRPADAPSGPSTARVDVPGEAPSTAAPGVAMRPEPSGDGSDYTESGQWD